MTEAQINEAIYKRTPLRDFDGEVGIPVDMEWVGFARETLVVTLVGENFRRVSDALDLEIA